MCCFWVRGVEVLCMWVGLWMLLGGVFFTGGVLGGGG